MQGVWLKTELRRTLNNGFTFPGIIYVIYSVIYHTLESQLVMTSFNFQACLTSGERIRYFFILLMPCIILQYLYCVQLWYTSVSKLDTIKILYYILFEVCVWKLLIKHGCMTCKLPIAFVLVQLQCIIWCLKLFVHEHAVQFNTEDYHWGKLYKEKNCIKMS
jgi:hypothetical protein